MGTGGSKHPHWYPGEPDIVLCTFRGCLCGREEKSDVAIGDGLLADYGRGGNRGEAATWGKNRERTIESLPVVELTDWEFIAHGTFCSVFSCKYRGFNVVAKRVRLNMPLHERRDALNNLWNEYECLRRLRHPNIVDVYGMCRLKREDNEKPWEEVDVCLVVERLALGTLGHLLDTTFTTKNLTNPITRVKKKKMLPIRRRLDRVLELALALEYVHGGSGLGAMMHRDLKSVNVGFAMNGRLKLIDFGLAKMVSGIDTNETDTYEMTGGVGSIRYMAPELVKQEPYNTKADIYSWAVLSWEILAICRPYSDVSEANFFKRVVFDGERPPLNKRWPKRLRDLLSSAWDPDLHKRPTISRIVMTLRILRAELVMLENRRSSSRLRPRNDDDGAGVGNGRDECRYTTRFVNSAPSTISGERPDFEGKGHDENSDGSFSTESMRTFSVRRRFSITRGWRSPGRRRSTCSEIKKPMRPFGGVGGKGSSAGAVAAMSDRDAGTTRGMSLSCEVLEGRGGAAPRQRGRKSDFYPTSFSRPSQISEALNEGDDHGVEGPRLAAAGASPNGTCPVHHDMFDLRDDLVKMFSKEREGITEEPSVDSDEVGEGPATRSSGGTYREIYLDVTRKLGEGRIETNQALEAADERKTGHATEALTGAVDRAPPADGESRTPTPSLFKRARNGATVEESVAACAQALEKALDSSAVCLGGKLTETETGTPPTTSCSRSSMSLPDLGKPANPDGAREDPRNGHPRGNGVRESRSGY